MILSANGSETKIETLGKNFRRSLSAEFDRKDLSGQTSSSAFSSAGNKPKKISASLQIPTSWPEKLTELWNLADALDEKENPVVYTVADELCKASKIRQVIFAGSLDVKEDDTLLVYNVNFALQEFNSAAEKREEREKEKAVPETPAADGEIIVGSVDHAKIEAAAKVQ
ncbi:MAG: hypothetical protein PHV82_11490 [Victivallaceae bacterium]|nr:hypothetical protein [Victivallaceae bacterium]